MTTPETLLLRAHSPSTTASILDSIQHKPLHLHPQPPPHTHTAPTLSGKTHSFPTARAQRRFTRQQSALARRRAAANTKAARPLSAKTRRARGLYALAPTERRWERFQALHGLWSDYVRGVLGADRSGGKRAVAVAAAGPVLAALDYHGAGVVVVRSTCPGRVGIEGVVVRDTKFTFEVIARDHRVRVVPKEGTVFRFRLPFVGSWYGGEGRGDVGGGGGTEGGGKKQEGNEAEDIVWEIHGQHFRTSAPDRANKKFKMHIEPGL